ncbi:MAG: GNAT family N-acetyltransferase [Hyphomicrobiales bacterium]
MRRSRASRSRSLIRPARRDELAAIRAVLVETWHDTYDGILGVARVSEITDDWHSLVNLARGLNRFDHAFLVADTDGDVAGTASATFDGDGLITLDRLYVRPESQGQRLGTALLVACVAHFPHARGLRLEVQAKNRKGRAFYARRGFSELPVRSDRGDEAHVVCEKALLAAEGGGAARILAVRPARDEDAQELFGLITLCFADYPGCYVDPHEDLRDLSRPAAMIEKRGGRFWVIEDESGRVGACASVDFPNADIAELHRVYVRPDLRRRGLAEALVALAEDEARARGAKLIFFWSDTRFLAAHRFYQRLSYRATGEERELADISHSREYRFEKGL